MKRTSFVVIAALSFAVASCEKEQAAESMTSEASVMSASSAAPSVASAAPTAGADEVEVIPVAADFEEEAEKTITKANYKAELDALEAELKK